MLKLTEVEMLEAARDHAWQLTIGSGIFCK